MSPKDSLLRKGDRDGVEISQRRERKMEEVGRGDWEEESGRQGDKYHMTSIIQGITKPHRVKLTERGVGV